MIGFVGCSTVNKNTYTSPELPDKTITTIAAMPLVVSRAARTEVSGTYSPGWISETFETSPLSPAEYLPAEQAFFSAVSHALAAVELFAPRSVDERMQNESAESVDEAITLVARSMNADAVFLLQLRDVVLREQSQIEGRATAMGESDLTLYDREGAVIWAVSSQNVFKTGMAGSPAPSLRQYVEFIMQEYE
jgi:hypothetical protein